MKQVIRVLWLPLALLLTMCSPMATAEPTPVPPTPVPVTFDSVCQQKEGTMVSINGYPRLYVQTRQSRQGATTFYEIFLHPGDPTGASVALQVVGANLSEKPGPNQMAALPLSYTFSDLHLVLNDGTEAPADAKLTMTGPVKPYFDTCLITVDRIELVQKT